jgi:hypothetical protein
MRKTTIAKMRRDGTVVEVLRDGTERPRPKTPMRPMTEAEVHAATIADADARPMTPDERKSARRVPRSKTLQRALGLTRDEFAALRADIDKGLAYLKAGRVRDFDTQDIVAQGRKLLARRRSRSG